MRSVNDMKYRHYPNPNPKQREDYLTYLGTWHERERSF